MKIFSNKKRAAAIGAVTAATVITGTVAFAYWTTSGTGNGGASTGTSSDFTVTITQADSDTLSPGGAVVDFEVLVENRGDGTVQLDEVGVALKSGWSVGTTGPLCDLDDFAISSVSRKSPSADIAGPAKTQLAPTTGTWTGTFTVQMNNLGESQDNCKGLVFNPTDPDSGIPLVATATS